MTSSATCCALYAAVFERRRGRQGLNAIAGLEYVKHFPNNAAEMMLCLLVLVKPLSRPRARPCSLAMLPLSLPHSPTPSLLRSLASSPLSRPPLLSSPPFSPSLYCPRSLCPSDSPLLVPHQPPPLLLIISHFSHRSSPLPQRSSPSCSTATSSARCSTT